MYQAIIVAAGTGNRTNLGYSKILYEVNGCPLFHYTLKPFLALRIPIILVVSKHDYPEVIRTVPPNVKVVMGGRTRGASVALGLEHVTSKYVLIHDGARPYLKKELIVKLQAQLLETPAVVLAKKMSNSLQVNTSNGFEAVNRDDYFEVETPQAFKTKEISQAYLENTGTYSDDLSLYQAVYHQQCFVLFHQEINKKITYESDLLEFNNLMKEDDMRIGQSFDIHQLVEARKLILGGIVIPYHKGLLGHSDADVLLHVVSEAIYGALGIGDLGTHFSDQDVKNKDMSSVDLLNYARTQLLQQDYHISNIDSTIYAEQPKLSKHIDAMKENIASILNIDKTRINIKASTYEKMDAIGQELAIAAEAVVLIRKKKE